MLLKSYERREDMFYAFSQRGIRKLTSTGSRWSNIKLQTDYKVYGCVSNHEADLEATD